METSDTSPFQQARPAPEHATRMQRRAGRLALWLADRIQHRLHPEPVRLELWDGSVPPSAPDRAVGSIVIDDPGVLMGLVCHADFWFGEAYALGRLHVRGPLEPVVEAMSRAPAGKPSWRDRLALLPGVPNTLRRARANVHHHYDLGNDFYRLWLDEEMVYTCAYFPHPEASLETAQRAKLDLVCRKVALRAGERVIDAGCGWGGLALHMARAYGARVRAFNVSREQIAYARARAAREGLSGLIEFVEDDYRNVTGEADVFLSIGMLEHVGPAHFRSLADVLRRTVHRAGGRGLLHFIGRDLPRPLNAWIRHRIFPGAYCPTLAEVTARVLGPAGMSVLDVENLRLHYARTLQHWGERFAVAADRVAASHGETFRRTWELYLAGSQAAFATGSLQLFQVVFAPRSSAPPYWTRAEALDGPA
jgi:cyclopropane-fatty-acyl-phospholipid synthase